MSDVQQSSGSTGAPSSPAAAAPSTVVVSHPQSSAPKSIEVQQAPKADGLAKLKEKAQAMASGAASAPSGEKPVSPSDPAPGGEIPPAAAVTEPPAFTPNFDFEAYDKKYQVDEFFRSLVKDPDSQEKVLSLHKKAFGFDGLKEMHTALKAEHKTIADKYASLDAGLQELSAFVKNDDLGSFFDRLQLPRQKIFDFVRNELAKMTAAPDQRAAMEANEQARREAFQLKQDNARLQSQVETDALQSKGRELDGLLLKPDIAAFGAGLDAKLGNGAFRKAVLERGQLAYNLTGQNIPFEEAIAEAMKIYAPFMATATPAAVPGSPQIPVAAAATEQITPQAPKPVIPSVSGGSTSPIKQGVRSIADIKKRAQQSARTGS